MSAFGGRRERVSVFIFYFGSLIGTVLKDTVLLDIVVHTFNPSMWKALADRSL